MDNGLVFAVDAMTIFPISREDSKGNLKRLFQEIGSPKPFFYYSQSKSYVNEKN